jgi:hypothetical protein
MLIRTEANEHKDSWSNVKTMPHLFVHLHKEIIVFLTGKLCCFQRACGTSCQKKVKPTPVSISEITINKSYSQSQFWQFVCYSHGQTWLFVAYNVSIKTPLSQSKSILTVCML